MATISASVLCFSFSTCFHSFPSVPASTQYCLQQPHTFTSTHCHHHLCPTPSLIPLEKQTNKKTGKMLKLQEQNTSCPSGQRGGGHSSPWGSASLKTNSRRLLPTDRPCSAEQLLGCIITCSCFNWVQESNRDFWPQAPIH